ncbi:ABC transporter ATP-binding protein [Thermococcus celer]|uniref:ABC transporter n=1 Tax=Thermococcus celer Vu 13 = JCM 8558 TaxID=1293037 RepID=A0A218P083_THECE|nr:ABC transporter ATP-binding protein [Thermococcus celer]ASI98325.1 ABC transporter [Thermococcus celer] [Thermococcus celer Vu 13 = JCM 8558]
MIEAVKLTKYYPPPIKSPLDLKSLGDFLGKPREEIPALVDLNFKVKEGEIYGLLGPNGAGKTTLCKIASALVIPTGGHLYIDGYESVEEHNEVKGKIFTIFGGSRDLFGLFQWRVSVEKNLRFMAELWGIPKAETDRRINQALELLHLKEKRNEWYQKLSAGMRQKVYLALPLVLQPEVLILDEPTVYLDAFTRREVWNAILRLSKELGTTILLTTHNLREAESLCDRVLLFNRSKIAEGTPKELIEEVQTLKAERKIIAKIKGMVHPKDFDGITQKIEVQRNGEFTYLQLYFKNEDIKEVLGLLSRYKIVDVQTSQVTLEEVFTHLCKK